MKYGRLTVIGCAGKDYRGKYLWECKCDCGNTKVVVGDNLSSGRSKSCGCLKREFLKRRGNQWGLYEDRADAIMKIQYHHIKKRHKKFGGVIMPYEDFLLKSKSSCFYCGLEYSKEIHDRLSDTKSNKKLSDTVVRINGIDRIDSTVGYTKENTVPCCKFCNTAKNTMRVYDFKKWVQTVFEHYVMP
jgi:hypothetical protein